MGNAWAQPHAYPIQTQPHHTRNGFCWPLRFVFLRQSHCMCSGDGDGTQRGQRRCAMPHYAALLLGDRTHTLYPAPLIDCNSDGGPDEPDENLEFHLDSTDDSSS